METLVDDALTEILLRLNDAKTLANCSLVCRRWAAILARSSPFWIAKCKRDGRVVPQMLLGPGVANRVDYRLIWRKNPYGRNLIKNDSGQERFKHWEIDPDNWDTDQTIHNGEVMRAIEKPPVNVNPGDIDCCFATSCYKGEKTQRVDLWLEGVQPWVLDEIKPKIVISEWHAARPDCGAVYNIHVALLDSNGAETGRQYQEQSVVPQWEGGEWRQTTYAFVDYPNNIRYVRFTSSGRDTQSWHGFFGAKMAKASVALEFWPRDQH